MRKQHDYSKFFMTDKKTKQPQQGQTLLERMIGTKKQLDNYTGYVPTKTREPPKMFVDPTEDELKDMIKKSILELMAGKGKNEVGNKKTSTKKSGSKKK